LRINLYSYIKNEANFCFLQALQLRKTEGVLSLCRLQWSLQVWGISLSNFDYPTAVMVKIQIFWKITSCRLVVTDF